MSKYVSSLMIVILLAIIFTTGVFAEDGKYILGPDDVIEISVWNNSELNRVITIREDGFIAFPLINEIKAAGLTPNELQQKVASGLQTYIKSPIVTVMVKEFKRIRVSVLGAVVKQDVYPVKPGTRLLEVLSLAGILEDTAFLEEVTLTRTDISMSINVAKLLNEGGYQNYVLQDGDVLYIPLIKREAYILGEVVRPGNYPIDSETSPAELLAMAGGPTERANLKQVKIIHRVGIEDTETINLEEYLQTSSKNTMLYLRDGDVVQIMEIKTIDWEKLFFYAAGIKVIRDLLINW